MTNLSFHNMTRQQRESTYILPAARTIKVLQTPLTSIKPNTTSLDLVIRDGSIGSIMGYKMTQTTLAYLYLTPTMLGILVGILLGDASIRAQGVGSKPCITHNQGFIHLEYSLWLAIQLSPILSQWPSLRQRRDGTLFLGLITRSLPCLVPLLDLFVVNGVKTISMSLIEYISPVSLAYWAMDDGTSTSDNAFYFGTHGFSFEEHIILQRILWIKFGLNSTIHRQGKYFRLFIPARDTIKLRALIRPYIIPSFSYKLGRSL